MAAPAQGPDAIQRVLAAYEDSYNRRDANAIAAIWKGVDRRGLSRAFSTLANQDFSFEQCNIDMNDDEAHATAQCRGAVRYVRRIGGSAPRVVHLAWKIELARGDDGWLIANLEVR